ncbi:MAG: glycosyltransferase family 2 protein [Candidatus Peribacteraceae bacterium]|nr:glycosyltransferase family 2 protein [Candidatus Peribacteraceae bacterium]
MKLSIVIPCFNELRSITPLLEAVERVQLGEMQKEIIVIDDCSTDGTSDLLKNLSKRSDHTFLFHDNNQGKGRALRTGFEHVTGDIVIIQDADLEYDPSDYPELIRPIVTGTAKVVYGSRERNALNKTHSGLSFYAGGLFLTWLTNVLYGSRLTDEPTCYKVFDATLLKSIPLSCTRFEFCPEVTAKILRRGIPIAEVPISYNPRKPAEGKKIGFFDGLHAIWTLIWYRFFD